MKYPIAVVILFVCLLLAAHGAQAQSNAYFRTIKDIEYANADGIPLLMDLDLPYTGGPYAVILWVHPGGWYKGNKGSGPAVREAYRGYAVARITYRFSTQAIFPAQIFDCKAAVRYLRAHAALYNLDPTRIGVWGTSSSGQQSALLGTSGGVTDLEGDVGGNLEFSSRVQAAVDWFGPVDFLQESSQLDPQCPFFCYDCADSPESRLIGCAIQTCPEATERANPIRYVTSDDPPFLIMHGESDCRVPIEQSWMLRDALLASGVDVTFVSYPNTGHGNGIFTEESTRQYVDAWLDQKLAAAQAQINFQAPAYQVNESQRRAVVTVMRTDNNNGEVSVRYKTYPGSATAASDYASTSGILKFAPHETSKIFSIPITDDTLDEEKETVRLVLSDPTGGAILGATSTATLTIVDDDPPPSLSVDDVAIKEGNTGASNAMLTIRLSAPSGRLVSVYFMTVNERAVSPEDYTARTGALSFSPGQTSKAIAIQIKGDLAVETDETFKLVLSRSRYASISRPQAVVTILNDD